MKLKITVEVLAEETGSPIAQGTITGELDLQRPGRVRKPSEPILTVRMGNILEAARQVIYADSTDLDNA
jgi:hypothetical protein